MDKTISIFGKFPNLIIGFSTKSDGNMRIRPSGSSEVDLKAKENRKRFLDTLEINSDLVVNPILEHSNNVLITGKNDAGKTIGNIDALITNTPQLFLNLTVADCLPIFLYDPDKQVIALIHAGWRGLESNIIKNVITKFKEIYNSDPASLVAGIGPHIGGCHYEVGNDVVGKFKAYPKTINNKDGKYSLDIGEVAKSQLVNLGLKSENIEASSECTFELDNKYFSFRRDKPEIIETMLAVFGMRY